MNILFCTDGSKISYQALTNFVAWFKNVTVDVISVADFSTLPEGLILESDKFALKCANSVDNILDYSELFLKEKGIKVNRIIKSCGGATDSILENEKNNKYQFIVLGSNGKKGIQKWLGSVSQEVASLCDTSVFVSKEANNKKSVLFTIDSSPNCIKTIKERYLNEFNLQDKEIHLMTVYDMPDYLFLEGNIDEKWITEIEKSQIKNSSELIDKFRKIFADNNYDIAETNIVRGLAAQEILKYAQDKKIDLIVAGMRERKHLSRFLLNSVSKRVLEYTNSDVLIIKKC